MRLLMDIGNSRLKWCAMQNGKLEGFGSCTHDALDDLTGSLQNLARPESIYLASVAGEKVNAQLTERLVSHWGVAPQQLVSQRSCCGVHNGYRRFDQMGVDRWAAMIAAYHLCDGPLCVVDCGSAMTVDVLDSAGHHLGGFIIPGLQMQGRQLEQETAGISSTDGEGENEAWGRDTASCIQLGALQAMAGLVERSADQLAEQEGSKVSIVLTGGDADGVMSLLNIGLRFEEHLVLQGMALMVRALEG